MVMSRVMGVNAGFQVLFLGVWYRSRILRDCGV